LALKNKKGPCSGEEAGAFLNVIIFCRRNRSRKIFPLPVSAWSLLQRIPDISLVCIFLPWWRHISHI